MVIVGTDDAYLERRSYNPFKHDSSFYELLSFVRRELIVLPGGVGTIQSGRTEQSDVTARRRAHGPGSSRYICWKTDEMNVDLAVAGVLAR
jgi:hypothetical protein